MNTIDLNGFDGIFNGLFWYTIYHITWSLEKQKEIVKTNELQSTQHVIFKKRKSTNLIWFILGFHSLKVSVNRLEESPK
jgi:hypothetical protein